MSLESLSDALSRLVRSGFGDAFQAEPDGLRARIKGTLHKPESLLIEQTVRFEGESDPSEEAIVFALLCEESRTRGTYTVVFGPEMDPLDVAMVERIREQRRGTRGANR